MSKITFVQKLFDATQIGKPALRDKYNIEAFKVATGEMMRL